MEVALPFQLQVVPALEVTSVVGTPATGLSICPFQPLRVQSMRFRGWAVLPTSFRFPCSRLKLVPSPSHRHASPKADFDRPDHERGQGR